MDREQGVFVGLGDRIGAAVDKAAGAAKDRIGAATNRPALQAEGQAQNAVGHARQTGHDVEEAARDIVDDE
ncbi:CsbD family protein [Kocuria aegyptia]|uniref:CsbD-like domain-containing protein n=1 Tax=Kocuria aegyptia TaxID=330943 RepID=A0ABP4WS06_9MICC